MNESLMNAEIGTTFTLIGTDEDDNALFLCSYCNNVIPLENDGTGDIRIADIGETCPECGANILRIDIE